MVSGCSAVGSARGLGPWGREFESLHPDQENFAHPIKSGAFTDSNRGPIGYEPTALTN